MSIDSNVKDFEDALKNMKGVVEALEPSLDEALLGDLKNVIEEYEGHLQSDIQGLTSKAMNLADKADEFVNDDGDTDKLSDATDAVYKLIGT